MTLFTTNQGLFVTSTEGLNSKVKQGKLETELVRNLLISNIDLNHKDDLKWISILQQQACNNFKLSLQIFRTLNREYIKILDENKKITILYVENGLIYIPECIIVESLKINKEKIEICFKEIPVSFETNGHNYSGFINGNGIISLFGNQIPCEINSNLVMVKEQENQNFYMRFKNEIKFFKLGDFNWINFNIFNKKIQSLNSHHPNVLMATLDELKIFNEIVEHKIDGRSYPVIPLENIYAKGTFEKYISNFKIGYFDLFNKVIIYVKWFGILVISVVVLLTTIFITFKIVNWVKNSKKPRKEIQLIQMTPFNINHKEEITTEEISSIDIRLKQIM